MKESSQSRKIKVITSPGFDGIPFRGEVIPDLTKEGPQPVEVLDAKLGIFDLSIEEHVRELEAIYNNIAKGLFVLSREEMEWMPTKENWKVFIRFLPRYAEMAGKALTRAKFDEQKGYIE